MRKILLSILLCTFAVATWAQTSQIRLTFDRSGDNVTVNVSGVEGVTATVVSKSHDWKDLGVTNANTILCPNVNGNTDPTITWDLQLNGVPTNYKLNGMTLDIHALNGEGNYQDPADNKTRRWNVVVAQGETTVANFDDIEISQGNEAGRTMNNNHKVHTVEVGDAPVTTDPMLLNFTITKGTVNGGCFFGLSEIILDVEEMPEPETPKVCNVVGRITAAELMGKTEPTYIAMRNVSVTNDNWFTGEVSSQNLTVFVWEPATDGKFYLKRYADELYLQESESTLSLGAQGTAAQFEAICPTNGGAGKHLFNNDMDSNPFIDIEGDSYIVRFAKADNAWINVQARADDPKYNDGKGGWTIQHVYEVEFLDAYTVNISDARYASFFAASECTVPEGVTAYYAKSEGVDLANEKIVLTEIENDIIPANTGVILYAPKADDTEYTFNASNTAAEELDGNLLKGTPASMNICMNRGQSAYVLSKQNSIIGLYKAKMTTKDISADKNQRDVFLNNARKAYLPASALPTSASVQGFKFGDFTSTAIEGVVTDNESAKVIYDLSGRRLNNITNAGVYIINGKKVMVK